MLDDVVSSDSKFRAIHVMLNPRSIAIVGATERAQYGGRFVSNLLKTGCKAELFPINPNRETIFDLPCYHSIPELPAAVDLAAIIIPAPSVLEALWQCAEKGVKSAVVISAGFAELGTEEGRARQAELQRLVSETGLRVCGPNCLGLANVAESIWAAAGSRLATDMTAFAGSIGLVSQSGATGFGPLIATAQDRRVGYRYIVSTGNEADLESSDFAQYMLQDPKIKVVAMLVEGFRSGRKFVETAELALEVGKPIVLLKVGRSVVGSRAAGSHTAAMTGSDVVQDALFRQKAVIRVDDYDELIETANMFVKAKPPRGERVGVVSHSGGIGSFLADKCGEVGLELPALSDGTRDKLREILGERGSAANPADVTGFALNDGFPAILQTLLSDEGLDVQVVASAGGESQAATVSRAAEECDKPVVFLWTGSFKDTKTLPLLQDGPAPVFYLPGRCAKGVRRLLDYHAAKKRILSDRTERQEWLAKWPEDTLERLGMLASNPTGVILDEHESKRILSGFGVPVTRESLCINLEEAFSAAATIGYPVALKVVSPDIPHKTEAGAVRLGIGSSEELADQYENMLRTVRCRCPHAAICGVLVQEMRGGVAELIAGVSRDPQFGPVLMLGLGGILVEAIGAASWRVCPITQSDARLMIGEVKGLSKLLAGFRGRASGDLDALVSCLVRISQMAVHARDTVASLDINPLAVLPKGQGVVALDALIVRAGHNAVILGDQE